MSKPRPKSGFRGMVGRASFAPNEYPPNNKKGQINSYELNISMTKVDIAITIAAREIISEFDRENRDLICSLTL